MTTISRRVPHPLRVAYGLIMFAVLVPFYVLHEGAHAVAALPWGGPSAAYAILDDSERGILRRVPVGMAVYHPNGCNSVAGPVITLAPLALIAPGWAILQLPGAWAQLAGGLVLLSGVAGLSDALAHFDFELYEEMLLSEDFRYVRVIDFTELGVDAPEPPESGRRDEFSEASD